MAYGISRTVLYAGGWAGSQVWLAHWQFPDWPLVGQVAWGLFYWLLLTAFMEAGRWLAATIEAGMQARKRKGWSR